MAVLPARSPMPLMVHSTCRQPAVSAAMLLAVARPRSLWQCVEKVTWWNTDGGTAAYTRARTSAMNDRYWCGSAEPTVSGRLMVVAPALMAVMHACARKSADVRDASSALHSMSAHSERA